MKEIAYIGVGSNLGDREENCQQAIALLRKHPNIVVTKISSLIVTKAITRDPSEIQPDYLNGAIAIETTLSPQELRHACKEIEKKIGRTSSPKRWQPRTIDLDILLFGSQKIQTPELTIPHPEIKNREFVITSLKEIGVSDENIYR